jgi:hypothetical protein
MLAWQARPDSGSGHAAPAQSIKKQPSRSSAAIVLSSLSPLIALVLAGTSTFAGQFQTTHPTRSLVLPVPTPDNHSAASMAALALHEGWMVLLNGTRKEGARARAVSPPVDMNATIAVGVPGMAALAGGGPAAGGGGAPRASGSTVCPATGCVKEVKLGARSLLQHWRFAHLATLGAFEDYELPPVPEPEVMETCEPCAPCAPIPRAAIDHIVDVALEGYATAKYGHFDTGAAVQRGKSLHAEVQPLAFVCLAWGGVGWGGWVGGGAQ